MNTLRDAVSSFVAFLPELVAGLIVLLIGWVVAAVLRRVVLALLPRMHFDHFLAKHEVVRRPPEKHAGSRIVASVAYWAILLIAFMQAANIWGLGFVANGISEIIAYIPNAFSAVIIFGLALLLGNWLRGRMQARASEQRGQSTFLPQAVRAGVLTIGAFLALRQLNIAPQILVIVFALVFGGIAVATAIAFGLGGRHTVERMTQDWYERQRPAGRSSGRADVSGGHQHA